MSISIFMTNKCSFLKVACSCWLFSQEVPFWMFYWILNVSLWNGTSMKWGNNFCIHANSTVLDFHFFSTLLFETNIQTSKTFFFKKVSEFYSTKFLIKSKQIKIFSQLVLHRVTYHEYSFFRLTKNDAKCIWVCWTRR